MQALELYNSRQAWASLADIMLVNLLMSGDNAVVIALAAQALPQNQRKPAIIFGSVAAIAMRTLLTVFALQLLILPYLKVAGGILLVVVAIKLLLDQGKEAGHAAPASLGAAIKTILVADLVMSLDNVLGVAAASHGNLPLLILGLLLSIPLIAFGSGLVMKLMLRFPVIIPLGAALLGYLGGEMLFADVALQGWLETAWPAHEWGLPGTVVMLSIPGMVAALLSVVAGLWLGRWRNGTESTAG
ncbi:MAG TPA: TerC family protein [Burkholderiaceae bacterium]